LGFDDDDDDEESSASQTAITDPKKSSGSDTKKPSETVKNVSFDVPGTDDNKECVPSEHGDTKNHKKTPLSNPARGLNFGPSPISPLAQFLIRRACASKTLANFLFWYLRVEADSDDTSLFETVLCALMYALMSCSESTEILAKQLYHSDLYLDRVTICQEDARTQMAWMPFSDKYNVVKEKLNTFLENRKLAPTENNKPEDNSKIKP
jgi:hypothetical protein